MSTAVRRLFLLVALALAGCAGKAPTFDEVAAGLSPVPADAARLIVYRDLELDQGLSWDPVFLNGKEIGAVGPGHVILRDLPPGSYRIEPKSEGLWPDQAKTVSLAAGQTAYAKITSFGSLDPSGNGTITTFVVTLVDPATGRREIGKLWYTTERRPAATG